MGVAHRNLAVYTTTFTGNGANDVTVKHYLGTSPSWVEIMPNKATIPTVLHTLVSYDKTNVTVRGESGTTYKIRIWK